jgi:hypothetical protein
MRTHMIAIACILIAVLPASSRAEPGVKHALCGGSGLGLSHSAAVNLSSFIGRCAGSHVLETAVYAGKETDPVEFARSSVGSGLAARVGLDQSYPNPFNPSTSIRYSVKAASRVTLKIYDIKGELIRTLVDEEVSPGEHVVPWDGMNARGVGASSGIYLVRLETEWGVFSRKIILAK